jgi:predicted transcriptional regulator
MAGKVRLRKDTDCETRFRCAGGIGILREEVWVDSRERVIRYNLHSCFRIAFGSITAAYWASTTHTTPTNVISWAKPRRSHSPITRQPQNASFAKRNPSGDAMKTKIFTDGFEGHAQRSLARAAQRDQGTPFRAEKVITFADPLDMAECLTVQRLRLWQVVRKKHLSISALAEELGRNRGSVTRDVNKLAGLGILRLRAQVNPGHGVLQIVEPVAQRLEMRVAL